MSINYYIRPILTPVSDDPCDESTEKVEGAVYDGQVVIDGEEFASFSNVNLG